MSKLVHTPAFRTARRHDLANKDRICLVRSSVQFQQATAEDTGLPDSSVDLVTVAQALHW